MDFLERLFGISTDGGNGAFELLLIMIPLAGLAIRRLWQNRRHA
ncbi:MAG TPA: hypothetical protein VGR95_16325 [Thermoanaerobaculia bacterium]|jgi:hypothetical protein|nr:hypothetical protein [Thermoanaerobaculia bacterium]